MKRQTQTHTHTHTIARRNFWNVECVKSVQHVDYNGPSVVNLLLSMMFSFVLALLGGVLGDLSSCSFFNVPCAFMSDVSHDFHSVRHDFLHGAITSSKSNLC